MPYETVIYSVDGPIATITLNRPERRNAINETLHIELDKVIDEAAQDDDVRVIVLTGAGKSFCAGDDIGENFLDADLPEWKNRGAVLRMLQGKQQQGSAFDIMQINKPSIAAVNGAALGYGCDVALACSMRVASEKAKFGELEVRMGALPGESFLLMPRLIGLAKTYEMILTTDIIDAAEALRIGLVNKVVPQEELMSATMEMANKIANNPPIAVRLAMEQIRRSVDMQTEKFMREWALALNYCLETEDHIEACKAFMEKRLPVFKGQ